MRNARATVGSVLGSLSLSTAVLGQFVGPAIKVNSTWGPDIGFGETVVAVSSQNSSEFVAAVIRRYPQEIVYAISVNAGVTMNRAVLSRAACFAGYQNYGDVDPMVAASPTTGERWVGALNLYAHVTNYPFPSMGMTVARLAPGATTLDPVFAALCPPGPVSHPNDKSLLAAGPRADNTSFETVYMAWYRLNPSLSPQNLVQASAPWITAAKPAGTHWQTTLPINPDPGAVNGIVGTGPAPLVIPSGLNMGRVVVAFAPATFSTGPRRWVVGDWSVAQQRLAWSQPQEFLQARVPGGGTSLHDIVGTTTTDLPGPIAAANFPGIAIDPNDPNKVYVVFAGRSDPSTPNSDLYVAQSLDGGATFNPLNTLHITDEMLGDVSGINHTDQFMCWIAIDGSSGINLLYYRAPATGSANPTLQAMHAHIASFIPGSTTPLAVYPLSPPFLAVVPPQSLPLPGGSIWIGDYHMNAAKGCIIWVCYVSTEEGFYNTYVRMIDICPADINYNGDVEPADVLAFGAAYASGSPPADVDRNGTINIQDATRFLEAYSCGCGAP